MLTKQVVLAFILHLAAEAKVEQPTQLLDWSTGWGGLDPGEQGKVEKMVQDAKDREEVARKELMEARADEQKAQDMAQSKHAKGGESQPSTVYPVHSKLVHAPIPTMEEVTAAKHRADEEEKRAAAAQQTAKKHLQKAEAAAKEASQSSDDRQREKAQKEAKSEAALATEAEHNATVKRLEAKIAHDKVRFMEIQSLRGGWQTESPSQWVEYASVGAGIFALALCAFLVPGRSKTAKQEPLKEPLLTEEPDWARESGDDEHSAEEWKQRAMAALERSRKSQEEMAGVKADAEVTKAQHAEQVAALEAKLKAEAGTTQSALNQKVTALEQKVEESQMALQAKSDEAAAAKQSLEDFKSQMAQADSHSAGMVDALREREEKLAAAHAETALLTERLQLAQENLDRTKKECLSAQAAAEEAQNMYQHALSKVDLNAEEEKARADLKQKSLSAAEQELEQSKQEVSNLSHKFEMERKKSVGLSEAHWTLQPAEAEQPQWFDISTGDESEELVLPEMPFAPPESEYSDDSDNETTEHLAQFPQAAKPQMFDMSTDSTAECKGQVANDDELSNAKAKGSAAVGVAASVCVCGVSGEDTVAQRVLRCLQEEAVETPLTDFKPRTRWGKVDRRKAAGSLEGRKDDSVFPWQPGQQPSRMVPSRWNGKPEEGKQRRASKELATPVSLSEEQKARAVFLQLRKHKPAQQLVWRLAPGRSACQPL